MKRLIALLLALTILAGCGAIGKPDPALDMEFAVNLFRESAQEGENTLVSPLSVMSALAMTANGAAGETLCQMETVLGGSLEDLNEWLGGSSHGENVKLANGMWLKDDGAFEARQDFLDMVKRGYDVKVEAAPFDDSTAKEINSWVKKQTDDMINGIVDEIPTEAVLYLVNALAFDAQWEKPYADYQVQEGVFITENGNEQTVEMMYDAVQDYLRTENAKGFLKWYEGGKYAFAALLPDEGVSVKELVDSLVGEKLMVLLQNPKADVVQTAIPKFRSETNLELSAALKNLGMTDAFDRNLADFSELGQYEGGNLNISRVMHKTYIEVGELGTRAGAATAVELEAGSAMVEPNTVYLDRPFVYMIVDMESHFPIFMGTCMTVQ